MPLIKCPECGKEISSFAESCPSCGCPKSLFENILANDTKLDENGEEEKIVTLTCPSCGSNEINMISDEYGVCNHCGSKVICKKEEGVKNVINITNNVVSDGSTSVPKISYYGIKKDCPSEVLYRDMLIYLARQRSCPADLFNFAYFDRAKEKDLHIASFTANVVGSYTCEVGYDKVKEWQEWNEKEQKYEKKTENYVEWQPFSGVYNGVGKSSFVMEECPYKGSFYNSFAAAMYANKNNKDYLTGTDNILEPTEEVMKEGHRRCQSDASTNAHIGLPGKHNRSFDFNGTSEITEITCYTVPSFYVKYTYKSEDYSLTSIATKDHDFYGTCPDNYDEVRSTIKESVGKTVKPLKIGAIVSILVFLAVSVLMIFTGATVWAKVGVIAAFFALALGVCISYRVVKGKKEKDTEDNLNKAYRLLRIKGLNNILREKKLEPLSPEEEALFS